MNILHYTIGLPPARRGGSVLYAYDLMRQQSRVIMFMLWFVVIHYFGGMYVR